MPCLYARRYLNLQTKISEIRTVSLSVYFQAFHIGVIFLSITLTTYTPFSVFSCYLSFPAFLYPVILYTFSRHFRVSITSSYNTLWPYHCDCEICIPFAMTCALRSCHQSLRGGEHGYLPLLFKPLSFLCHLPFPITPPCNPMDLQLITSHQIIREKTLIVSVGQVMK
jgi:hypothetical protein